MSDASAVLMARHAVELQAWYGRPASTLSAAEVMAWAQPKG